MEADKNPFPKIDLFPILETAKKIGHFLFDHITSPGLSDHNTGGGPALDRALYDEPTAETYGQGTLFDEQGIHRDSIARGDDW